MRHRWFYAGGAVLLLITEVFIALCVHDRFVRPHLQEKSIKREAVRSTVSRFMSPFPYPREDGG